MWPIKLQRTIANTLNELEGHVLLFETFLTPVPRGT